MWRSGIVVLAALSLNSSVSYAGFEFLPAKQVSSAPSQQSQMAPPLPLMSSQNMGTYQPAPVSAEPLGYNNPTPPATEKAQTPQATAKTGLYIDPYPLRDDATAQLLPNPDSIAQGMAEQSGGLTPVRLGNGMTTGAKAKPMTMVKAEEIPPQIDPMPLAAVSRSNLIPMPGGEPSPLPSIEDAYNDQAVTQKDFGIQYANTVGFGRELPLELALSQVIPSNYSSLITGVNKDDVTVTWEGGEPWNVVLQNMLRPHNLTAVINGNQVIIQPSASS